MYLDDELVYYRNPESTSHLTHLRIVLTLLRQHK
jgi:hypothetical protein